MSKIMLVEDDDNLRNIYADRLMAEGYEIVAARDGEEALAMAVNEKPDLIISDVMMPKISGFDMLDILRSTAETKNTKVIMMTALSQKEDQERGEKLGANRYLVKSQVTLEDVVRVAAEVIAEDAGSETLTINKPRERTVAEVAAEAQAALNSIAGNSTAPTAPPLPAVKPETVTTPEPATPTPPTPSVVPEVSPAPEKSTVTAPEVTAEAPSSVVSQPAEPVAPTASPAQYSPASSPLPVGPPAPATSTAEPRSLTGQKVITPAPTTETKPDINSLYQAELEKEQTSPATDQPSDTPPASANGGINPNEISI